jgi:hypothetical protein
MVIRPFHASLEVSLQEEFLNTFRDGETRVLIYTGAYHISRDNSNMGTIEVAMNWNISLHLTSASQWQRIWRASRDPEDQAIWVLLVEQKQILPTEIPVSSEWVDFNLAVSEQTEEHILELIKCMYILIENGNLIATATHYHHVDPPILWYVNTTDCRCRCVMAIFLQYNAFSHQPRVKGCCDNTVFCLG